MPSLVCFRVSREDFLFVVRSYIWFKNNKNKLALNQRPLSNNLAAYVQIRRRLWSVLVLLLLFFFLNSFDRQNRGPFLLLLWPSSSEQRVEGGVLIIHPSRAIHHSSHHLSLFSFELCCLFCLLLGLLRDFGLLSTIWSYSKNNEYNHSWKRHPTERSTIHDRIQYIQQAQYDMILIWYSRRHRSIVRHEINLYSRCARVSRIQYTLVEYKETYIILYFTSIVGLNSYTCLSK